MKTSPNKKFSDAGLITLLKRDDARALDEIFERYWERLFNLADKVLEDESVSKDIVQEIFVSLWERRQELEINGLSAYLSQAVRYKVASHLRRGKWTDKHMERLESRVFVNQTEEALNFNDLEKTILTTLDHLPDRCQEIFYLSRFEGLSNSEIAQKLNLSIRTVETQISRALRFLRTEIKPSLLSFLLLLFY
ncbi:MAG: RNA polymerase sigma-70 factor [Bacteroidota bacterium]